MKIEAFLFCEDIRLELGNKFSLMGVLGDTLGFVSTEENSWPKHVNLAVFVRLAPFGGEVIPDSVILNFDLNGEAIGEVVGSFNVLNKNDVTNVPINLPRVPIKQTGNLNFHMKFLSGENTLVEEIRTLKIETTSE